MIPIIHLRRIAIFGIVILSIMACSNDDENMDRDGGIVIPPDTNFITEIIENTEDFSSFHSALEITGLDVTLAGQTQKFTVFAPNNAAFMIFLTEKGFENINAVPEEFLTQLVRNHIIFGELLAGDIYTESLKTTANGHSIYFNVSNDIFINGISKVTTTNIKADNGVIHEVDAVIDMPDITTFLMADPNFESLIEAFTRDDDFDYVALLQSQGDQTPFTFLAPTNEAFEALMEEIEMGSIDEISKDDLEAILKYHIVPKNDFNDYDSILTTLETGQITMIYDWDYYLWRDENNREGYVNRVYIATNGNIYSVDKVLLPDLAEDSEIGFKDNTTLLLADPDFEMLIEAFTLDKSFDYLEYLKSEVDPAPFTVFAPTNEAFEALLEELELESLWDIPLDDLEAILKYHVVPDTNFDVNNLRQDINLVTLETGQILVRYDPIDYNYWVDESNRVDYLFPGTKASNGYLYKVDKVLLPRQ
ncbi:MAG TPA: fasciclin domain-containing protein [Gillisia sp.]|nr:fasciclin domain-containing protein [Gillisia sp.]